MQGDHILVNKTIPGARIFNLLASLRGEQVKISRLPRTQAIKKGDVLVFNNPFPYGNKKIRMHIMNYYAKRCAGLPGDSLKENKNNTLSLTYIPKSGDCVIINQNNYFLYHKLIAWEQQEIVELRDSLVYLNGKLLTEYCFQKNYYYMLGDNEALSHDSRFWGLLPEEYIVGKAWVIWKSKDTETNKIRWNRFLKKI
jgi:signal peptidase I